MYAVIKTGGKQYRVSQGQKLRVEKLNGNPGDKITIAEVEILVEPGELAETLLEALDEIDHPMVGVNFDPANMILYGMGDPVRAVADLADYIEQVHIKDATATTVPGTWGSEVPAGSGQVRWEAFFGVLEEYGVSGDLVIEREAGDQRIADVATGAALVRRLASNLA